MLRTASLALAATLLVGLIAEALAQRRPGVGFRPGVGAGAPGVGVRPGVGVGGPDVGVVRGGPYRYPAGYAYRRRAVGGLLSRAFLVPTYYYAGYAALGLRVPQAGYQWVRYGPDLLLVKFSTGSVIDVKYGVIQ